MVSEFTEGGEWQENSATCNHKFETCKPSIQTTLMHVAHSDRVGLETLKVD